MKNLSHIILSISTHKTLEGQIVPTIPGSGLYNIGSFITVYGPAIDYIHYPIAFCREMEDGRYFVIAEESTIQKLDFDKKGQTIEDLGDDWLIWRCDGNEPDEVGGRRNIVGKIIKLEEKISGMCSASGLNPVMVKGGIVVENSNPSIDVTIGGYDFVTVIESSQRKRQTAEGRKK